MINKQNSNPRKLKRWIKPISITLLVMSVIIIGVRFIIPSNMGYTDQERLSSSGRKGGERMYDRDEMYDREGREEMHDREGRGEYCDDYGDDDCYEHGRKNREYDDGGKS